MKRTATELIAQYAADARHPPHVVIRQAKLHIADTLACIYAGTGTDPVKILAEANDWTGTPCDVPVPGWGYAKTLDGAAQLLGTAAHAYDFDDTSLSMPGHPSAPIVAALLATVFDLSRNPARAPSGLQFIHAYVKGMEVACKVGERLDEDHKDQGWHTISTVGLLGAAVACAALRGLDASESERALAIAGSHACGVLNNSGTMVKPLHCGLAARAGYMAATLAEKGFTAGDDILEGGDGFIRGFVHAFTGGRRAEVDLPLIDMSRSSLPPLDDENFELINPGIEVKRYPCCQVAHVCIDAMKKARARRGFDVGNVEKILCYVSSALRMTDLQCQDPKDPTEARFSMNFTVTAAMLYGEVTLDHFNLELLTSNEFQQFMPLVEMRLQDKKGGDAVDIEVILKDGSRILERGTYVPISWDDVVSKFGNCMKYAAQTRDPKPILAMLQQLDVQQDMSGVFLGKPSFTPTSDGVRA